jgi:hypothetical protein
MAAILSGSVNPSLSQSVIGATGGFAALQPPVNGSDPFRIGQSVVGGYLWFSHWGYRWFPLPRNHRLQATIFRSALVEFQPVFESRVAAASIG